MIADYPDNLSSVNQNTDERYAFPLLAFYGRSNSGKTTIVERVIAELTRRGARVASIKGHLHNLEFDVEGKDSHRHRKAGAQLSMLATPSGWMAIHNTDKRVELPIAIEEAKRSGCEVLIVEGFKEASVPKIEVTVKNRDSLDVEEIVDNLMAEIMRTREKTTRK